MEYKIDVSNLTIKELEELKYSVESELKAKKGGKRKPKQRTKPEDRKPTFNVKKSRYVELEIRDEEAKVRCFYIGVIGSQKAKERLAQYIETWPDIGEEYKELVNKYSE